MIKTTALDLLRNSLLGKWIRLNDSSVSMVVDVQVPAGDGDDRMRLDFSNGQYETMDIGIDELEIIETQELYRYYGSGLSPEADYIWTHYLQWRMGLEDKMNWTQTPTNEELTQALTWFDEEGAALDKVKPFSLEVAKEIWAKVEEKHPGTPVLKPGSQKIQINRLKEIA